MILKKYYFKLLPDPDEPAEEIVENVETGLESFKAIIASLSNNYYKKRLKHSQFRF